MSVTDSTWSVICMHIGLYYSFLFHHGYDQEGPYSWQMQSTTTCVPNDAKHDIRSELDRVFELWCSC